MRISRMLAASAVMLSISVSACAGPAPSASEIQGTWSGRNGAELDFFSNGDLVLKDIPENYFLLDGSQKPVSGRGSWRLMQKPGSSALMRGANWWDVEISISSFDGHPGGARTPIHYAGDNQRNVLFFWKDEEGGDRFELYRH